MELWRDPDMISALVFAMITALVIFCGVSLLQGRSDKTDKAQSKKKPANRISKELKKLEIRKKSSFSSIASINEFFTHKEWARNFSYQLSVAGIPMPMAPFLAFCGCAGAGTYILLNIVLFVPMITSFIIAAIVALTPFFYVRYKFGQYVKKFSEQFPNALSMMGNSLAVGHSLESVFTVVAESMKPPISREFSYMEKGLKIGLPIITVLNDLKKRIPNDDIPILITAVAIQQHSGGNLRDSLKNIEKTIRQRYALRREIDALSAEGKFSIKVLLFMPLVILAIQWWGSKEPLMFFIESFVGRMILLLCVVLMVLAYWIAKKMVRLV